MTDLAIALPPTWRRTSAPDHGVLVAARAATVPPSGFRPEVVLRCGPASLEALARRLHDFAVEDTDELDLFGRDVSYRRFAHRVGGVDVVCVQWSWHADGPMTEPAITLTGSVARSEYADYCEVFEAIAETVELGPRAA